MHLSQNCQVVEVARRGLTLGFTNAGARSSFDAGGSAEIVRQAVIDVIGVDWSVETIIDAGADATATTPPGPPAQHAQPARQVQPTAAPEAPVAPAAQAARPPRTPAAATQEAPPPWAVEPPADLEPPEPPRIALPEPPDDGPRARPPAEEHRPRSPADLQAADADAHPDDDDDSENLGGADLLARELGARTIEEIRHP
jgi:DNA polymerase-3 subunit gamma/tau